MQLSESYLQWCHRSYGAADALDIEALTRHDGCAGQEMTVGGTDEPVEAVTNGYELAIPADEAGGTKGKVLGSREFARFYKQRPRLDDTRHSFAVNQVLARYCWNLLYKRGHCRNMLGGFYSQQENSLIETSFYPGHDELNWGTACFSALRKYLGLTTNLLLISSLYSCICCLCSIGCGVAI